MITRKALRRIVAAACTGAVGLLASTGAATAEPHEPSTAASCVASVTVAETRIAPGFVGDEVRSITRLGPGALASVVRSLAGSHLGEPEQCAGLVGE